MGVVTLGDEGGDCVYCMLLLDEVCNEWDGLRHEDRFSLVSLAVETSTREGSSGVNGGTKPGLLIDKWWASCWNTCIFPLQVTLFHTNKPNMISGCSNVNLKRMPEKLSLASR